MMKSNRLAHLCVALVMFLVVAMAADAEWVLSHATGRLIPIKRLPKETPELQVEYARSLMTQGDFNKAWEETDKFVKFYGDDPDFADDNQFIRGEIRFAQAKYMDAAREFQQVVSVYPDTDLFDQVIAKQYEIADTFYDLGMAKRGQAWWRPFKTRPFGKAIKVYAMVIDNQPFTAAAAEAQYKVGLCHYALDEYVEAAFEYSRVIEDYSGSDWVDEACFGLAMCYYEGSYPAEYDQGPGRLAIAAIDDFKARFPGDSRIPELDAKRAEMRNVIAMQRMNTAKFYEKRRRFRAAELCYEVVAEQFADTASAGEARAWLAQHRAGMEG